MGVGLTSVSRIRSGERRGPAGVLVVRDRGAEALGVRERLRHEVHVVAVEGARGRPEARAVELRHVAAPPLRGVELGGQAVGVAGVAQEVVGRHAHLARHLARPVGQQRRDGVEEEQPLHQAVEAQGQVLRHHAAEVPGADGRPARGRARPAPGPPCRGRGRRRRSGRRSPGRSRRSRAGRARSPRSPRRRAARRCATRCAWSRASRGSGAAAGRRLALAEVGDLGVLERQPVDLERGGVGGGHARSTGLSGEYPHPSMPDSATTRSRSSPSGSRCGPTSTPGRSRTSPTGGRKAYVLEMLPYPSGEPHIGHLKTYSVGDAVAHFRRRTGHRVLHPMGYDAFGLPAENHAIKTGQHPRESTEAVDPRVPAPVPRVGHLDRLDARVRHARARVLPLDPVDLPAPVRARRSPTARRPRSSGAPTTRPFWPTSR